MVASCSVCCGVFPCTMCVLMYVMWVSACRWGPRVLGDSRRRGQQSRHFRQLETGELLAVSLTPRSLCPGYLVLLGPTPWLASCSLGHLQLFSDFRLSLPALKKWKKQFVQSLWWANDLRVFECKECVRTSAFICVSLCSTVRGESCRSSCAHCTWAFWSSLIRKSGNHSVVNLICFNSNPQLTRTFLAEGKNCCGYASSTFYSWTVWMSWYDPVAMIFEKESFLAAAGSGGEQ